MAFTQQVLILICQIQFSQIFSCSHHLAFSLASCQTQSPLVQNQFDSIDLSDNAIMILEGFPQLPRLKTLYLNNNRIVRVGRNLEGKCHKPEKRYRSPTSLATSLQPFDTPC